MKSFGRLLVGVLLLGNLLLLSALSLHIVRSNQMNRSHPWGVSMAVGGSIEGAS